MYSENFNQSASNFDNTNEDSNLPLHSFTKLLQVLGQTSEKSSRTILPATKTDNQRKITSMFFLY